MCCKPENALAIKKPNLIAPVKHGVTSVMLWSCTAASCVGKLFIGRKMENYGTKAPMNEIYSQALNN